MINKIDFLSPPITLFHLERRTHTSNVGGTFVILMVLVCTLYIVHLFFNLISHKEMTTVINKKFEFEAGYYSFNSTSIFHFIQIFSTKNGGYFDKYDSKYVRTYTTYAYSNFSYSNLDLYDHWVFDNCRKGIDDKDLEPYLFENIENFTNGVCIRYYFNSTEKKYHKIGDNGFIWPHLEHGTARRNNIYLTTIIQKCSNDSIINEIFGNCPSQKEIDNYISKYFSIYLYFTDMKIDPTNYSKPGQKYLQVVTSRIGNSNNFVESYIHFSPLRVRTKLGTIFGSSYDINSFYFDYNSKGSANNDEKYFIITKYYHLMQNNVQIYERKYNNFFDLLAEIGGVIQFIFYLFYWINYIYNKYIIAYDTNSLFFSVRGEQLINHGKGNNIIKSHNFENSIIHHNKLNRKSFNKEKLFYIYKNSKNLKTKFNGDNILKKFDFEIPSNSKNMLNSRYNSSNYLLKDSNNFIFDRLQKLNNNSFLDYKKEINKKNFNTNIRKSNEDIINNMVVSKKSLYKIKHKKSKTTEVLDDKLKSVRYFSYIDYLKSLLFKKEKESYNFIRLFRKHLLSEEHLFKTHIKLIFLEKQINSNEQEKLNVLECFSEL